MRADNRKRFCILYAAILLLLVAAGRITGLAYSYVAVDIAFAPWVADALQYGTEVLNAAKTALGYAGISYALWHFSVKAGLAASLVFFIGPLLENAARFFIDLLSSALVYYGLPMALLSLGIQLLYETVFLLFAFLIALFFRRKHLRDPEGCDWNEGRGARWAVLLFMASVLGQEVIYLIDYLRTYGGMSITEIAVSTGSFLKIIVIYGGAALLVCEGALQIFRGRKK